MCLEAGDLTIYVTILYPLHVYFLPDLFLKDALFGIPRGCSDLFKEGFC